MVNVYLHYTCKFKYSFSRDPLLYNLIDSKFRSGSTMMSDLIFEMSILMEFEETLEKRGVKFLLKNDKIDTDDEIDEDDEGLSDTNSSSNKSSIENIDKVARLFVKQRKFCFSLPGRLRDALLIKRDLVSRLRKFLPEYVQIQILKQIRCIRLIR